MELKYKDYIGTEIINQDPKADEFGYFFAKMAEQFCQTPDELAGRMLQKAVVEFWYEYKAGSNIIIL